MERNHTALGRKFLATKRIFLFLERLSKFYNISTPTDMSALRINKHNTQELSIKELKQ